VGRRQEVLQVQRSQVANGPSEISYQMRQQTVEQDIGLSVFAFCRCGERKEVLRDVVIPSHRDAYTATNKIPNGSFSTLKGSIFLIRESRGVCVAPESKELNGPPKVVELI
jgi:hypothetical protein